MTADITININTDIKNSEKPRWIYRFDNYKRAFFLLREAIEILEIRALTQTKIYFFKAEKYANIIFVNEIIGRKNIFSNVN